MGTPAMVCPSSKRKASVLSQFSSPQPAAGIKRIARGVSSQSQISPLKPALPLLSRPRTDSFGLRSEQSQAATAAIAARIGTPSAITQETSFGDPGTGRPGIPLFYTRQKGRSIRGQSLSADVQPPCPLMNKLVAKPSHAQPFPTHLIAGHASLPSRGVGTNAQCGRHPRHWMLWVKVRKSA